MVDTNKRIIIPVIGTLRSSKFHHIVINKQPGPSPKLTKASDIFLIPGDDDMVKHISLINK